MGHIEVQNDIRCKYRQFGRDPIEGIILYNNKRLPKSTSHNPRYANKRLSFVQKRSTCDFGSLPVASQQASQHSSTNTLQASFHFLLTDPTNNLPLLFPLDPLLTRRALRLRHCKPSTFLAHQSQSLKPADHIRKLRTRQWMKCVIPLAQCTVFLIELLHRRSGVVNRL